MPTTRGTYLYIILLVALITGCNPVKHSFVAKTNLSPVLFNRIADSTRGDSYLIDTSKSIGVYKTVFREYQVETDNVIEYAIMNDASKKERVTYTEFIGYWQEIYLFKVQSGDGINEAFVYFSVRFRGEKNEKKHKVDTACIGFGPAYYGTLTKKAENYIINFTEVLKPAKRDGHFELIKKGSANMKFIIPQGKYSDKSVFISKIVIEGHNKIGGDKSLVYEPAKILNDSLGLTFYRTDLTNFK